MTMVFTRLAMCSQITLMQGRYAIRFRSKCVICRKCHGGVKGGCFHPPPCCRQQTAFDIAVPSAQSLEQAAPAREKTQPSKRLTGGCDSEAATQEASQEGRDWGASSSHSIKEPCWFQHFPGHAPIHHSEIWSQVPTAHSSSLVHHHTAHQNTARRTA